LFLRNHDELTLEMVTDEERDYMYRMYAQVHQARLNLGIRRRLAPLLATTANASNCCARCLFSLPGTPVIYYGDEIGMGENIYLGDRNGVRTPMQWSADKNAGFSRANPQSLYPADQSGSRKIITRRSMWKCRSGIIIRCSGG
jgi:maltose alpha-D-glucosyltransferase/alpha-amylase